MSCKSAPRELQRNFIQVNRNLILEVQSVRLSIHHTNTCEGELASGAHILEAHLLRTRNRNHNAAQGLREQQSEQVQTVTLSELLQQELSLTVQVVSGPVGSDIRPVAPYATYGLTTDGLPYVWPSLMS